MSPTRHEFKLYHGGARGLSPGQKLLPPSLTGASSCADYDGEHCRSDRVYLTTDLEEATVYVALAPRGRCGDVYEVEPTDEPEPDPSCATGTTTFTTRAAIVVAVVRRDVDVEEASARMRTLLLALSTDGVLARGDTNFGRDRGRLATGRAGGAINPASRAEPAMLTP